MTHPSDRDVLAPSPYPGIFSFEVDFGGTLRCIPMSVRLKLDLCGVKLSLKQWSRMPAEQRRMLVVRSCDTADQTAAYRRAVMKSIEDFTASAAQELPVDPTPPWSDRERVPERVVAWAFSLGLPAPSPAQWRNLGAVQRFALYKLTRPGHSNENFIPAMREFRILPSPDTPADETKKQLPGESGSP